MSDWGESEPEMESATPKADAGARRIQGCDEWMAEILETREAAEVEHNFSMGERCRKIVSGEGGLEEIQQERGGNEIRWNHRKA